MDNDIDGDDGQHPLQTGEKTLTIENLWIFLFLLGKKKLDSSSTATLLENFTFRSSSSFTNGGFYIING
ncbi:hypothetical protein DERP_012145 [Dermatophagoides pteronyssinus]|uniref:Uncharacterized protein n=1 Tax=Dermatophagoides pteronyssinus TaxID=6956 RepID=A0ABQ8J290_DERPT|nr:hypothetical protein DERP_012145 [Dermatophagoides pteronyssinus]